MPHTLHAQPSHSVAGSLVLRPLPLVCISGRMGWRGVLALPRGRSLVSFLWPLHVPRGGWEVSWGLCVPSSGLSRFVGSRVMSSLLLHPIPLQGRWHHTGNGAVRSSAKLLSEVGVGELPAALCEKGLPSVLHSLQVPLVLLSWLSVSVTLGGGVRAPSQGL